VLARLSIVIICLAALSGGTAHANASPTPTGRWITANGKAVVQIYPCGNDICGAIVGLETDHPSDPMPTDWQGKPQCGLVIINTKPGTNDAGQPVWNGQVLDPRNGAVYQAQLKLEPDRHLLLHGYIGIPVFGQTQTWTPYSGRTMSDCRMSANDSAAPANG
jgi:uncharacterized protein (DUF2147 family)